jgi:hypothetical protein
MKGTLLDGTIGFLMVLVDKHGGDVTITSDDLARIADGKNELHLDVSEDDMSVRLQVIKFIDELEDTEEDEEVEPC